jgi:hypothetical protein
MSTATKGTPVSITAEMKWTLRDSRSSELGDQQGRPVTSADRQGADQLGPGALFTTFGLHTSAKMQPPVLATCRATASRCVSMPRPDAPCRSVLTRR